MKIVNRSLNPLPKYATKGSSGLDIRSNETYTLMPMERALISTGLYISIPEGYEGQLRARSGNAIKWGVTLINGVGTIDEDYTGELKIPLINLGPAPFEIGLGDRIAQLIIAPYKMVTIEEVEELEETDRKGGFGSTGR